MRKNFSSALISASMITGIALTSTPVLGELSSAPKNQQTNQIAQADFELPEGLPGISSDTSSQNTNQSSNQTSNTQNRSNVGQNNGGGYQQNYNGQNNGGGYQQNYNGQNGGGYQQNYNGQNGGGYQQNYNGQNGGGYQQNYNGQNGGGYQQNYNGQNGGGYQQNYNGQNGGGYQQNYNGQNGGGYQQNYNGQNGGRYQQNYNEPANGSVVPPDIVDAPAPYASNNSNDSATRQLNIMNSARPNILGNKRPPILPADFAKRPLLGIIKIDSNGNLLDEPVKLASNSQFSDRRIVSNLEQIIAPAIKNKLSDGQKQSLLNNPMVILSSVYAAQIFNCQRVLVLQPSKSKTQGIDVDLRTLSQNKVYSLHSDDLATTTSDMVDQICRKNSSSAIQVVSNKDSRMYHRADADHLSKTSPQTKYAEVSQAEERGLKPCPLCFPEVEYSNSTGASYSNASVPDGLALSHDEDLIRRLSEVSTQIAYTNSLSPSEYRTFLLADSDYKAFSYVNGPILISEGVMNIMDTPGELASVVAHEMAHLKLGHVKLLPQSEQTKNQENQNNKKEKNSRFSGMLSGLLGNVITYTTGSYWAGWGVKRAAELGSNIKISFPKHQEEEADRQAVLMSFTAGYSPQDYVLSINKIGAAQQRHSNNSWLNDHRKVEERLNNIRGLIGKLSGMEIDMRSWERDDPNVCIAWRKQVQTYLDDPRTFEDFSSAYKIATSICKKGEKN